MRFSSCALAGRQKVAAQAKTAATMQNGRNENMGPPTTCPQERKLLTGDNPGRIGEQQGEMSAITKQPRHTLPRIAQRPARIFGRNSVCSELVTKSEQDRQQKFADSCTASDEIRALSAEGCGP